MNTNRTAAATVALASAALLAGCGVPSIPQGENAVAAAWSEVENQYQRRADLVPNLVETVKGYAAHELDQLDVLQEAAQAPVQGHHAGRRHGAQGEVLRRGTAAPTGAR